LNPRAGNKNLANDERRARRFTHRLDDSPRKPLVMLCPAERSCRVPENVTRFIDYFRILFVRRKPRYAFETPIRVGTLE
jgi:hypothetical protein